MNTDSDTSSVLSEHSPLQTLRGEIEYLKTTTDFLLHRVDSIQKALEQDTFSLSEHTIQIHPTGKPAQVRLLLIALGLEESSLTVGRFLKALNIYLLKNDLVDLNDLQIHLNPLLKAAFHKPLGLKKVPYGLLLNTLPKMFL